MIPTFLTTISIYIIAFLAPPGELDGIHKPVARSLLYVTNSISEELIPSSNVIGVHVFLTTWPVIYI